MTILWGTIKFEGPNSVLQWDPPRKAAVYVVMAPGTKPDHYKAIYFGESENLSERGFYKSHQAYPCWIKQAGAETNLYIGVYPMPNSTMEQRRVVEQMLIKEYNPVCNKQT